MADNSIKIDLVIDGKEAQASLQTVNKDMDNLQGSLTDMTSALSGIMRDLNISLSGLSRSISSLSIAIGGMNSGADKSGSGLKEWGEGVENAGSMMSSLGTALTKTSPSLTAFGGALSAIGPWGMAAGSALQFLGPVIDMIQDKSRNAANNGIKKFNEQLELMSLTGLKAERDRLSIEKQKLQNGEKSDIISPHAGIPLSDDEIQAVRLYQSLNPMSRLESKQLSTSKVHPTQKIDKTFEEINKIDDKLQEVNNRIIEKETEFAATLDDQRQSLIKQLEVENAGSASARRIAQLKQEYDKRKELTEQLFSHQKINIQERNSLLLQIERSYQSSVSDIRDQEFKAQENELKIKYSNAEAEAKIQSKGNYSLLVLKKQHLDEMIALYNKYGKDVTELQTKLADTEAAISERTELKGVKPAPLETGKPAVPKELDTVKEFGNADAYEQDWQKSVIDRQRDELDIAESTEMQKAGMYQNAEEMRTAIHKKYSKYRKDLDDAEAQHQMDAALGAMNYIGGAVGQNTVLGKAASVANATMSTYEAATKALTAGPILGPILAGVITGLGLANVSKILSIETPKMGGYARGGIVVGEQGPEIIAPMQDYASGQALLIQQTVLEARRALNSAQYSHSSGENQTLIQEMRKLNSNFEGYSSRPITITKDAVGKIVSQGNSQLRKSRV